MTTSRQMNLKQNDYAIMCKRASAMRSAMVMQVILLGEHGIFGYSSDNTLWPIGHTASPLILTRFRICHRGDDMPYHQYIDQQKHKSISVDKTNAVLISKCHSGRFEADFTTTLCKISELMIGLWFLIKTVVKLDATPSGAQPICWRQLVTRDIKRWMTTYPWECCCLITLIGAQPSVVLRKTVVLALYIHSCLSKWMHSSFSNRQQCGTVGNGNVILD